MIPAILSLAAIPLAVLYFLHYAAGLTRRPHELTNLADTYAGSVLNELQTQFHIRLSQKLPLGERRGYHRDLMHGLMPLLLSEARMVTLASRDLVSLVLFGVFCLAYGTLWAKSRLFADVEDIRILIGADAFMLRRATA